MSQANPPVSAPLATESGVVFVPGEKFFVRRVPVSPDGDVVAQVALAIEGFSPFPAAQLFYGFRTNSARTQALVFAAYRKNFTPEELAQWTGAAAVLPAFAVWLGAGSVPAAGISVREESGRMEVIAWDGQSELPSAIIVRKEIGDDGDEFIAEATAKAGLRSDASVKVFKSPIQSSRENRELVVALRSAGIEARFDEALLDQADIRDKEVLVERRQTLRRDKLLWRGFAGLLIGLAACVVLELGLLGTRAWLVGRQGALNAQIPVVRRIEQAQSMAKRLEEISTQRLLPFEMLNALNNKRPQSVEFDSVTTKGLWGIDVQAHASSAEDSTTFETDLRQLAGIEKVEVFDKRFRDGVTTFRVEVTFKPGWAQTGGGA